MPITNESERGYPKPIELMIADSLFVRLNLRNQHFEFKDIKEKYVHYSAWFYGSTFDLHRTIEPPHDGDPRVHVPILKKELNLQLVTERIAQDICANANSLVKLIQINNDEVKDLDVKFISVETLKELFSNVVKGNRWTLSEAFSGNFENALHRAKLRDLSGNLPVLGWSSAGHFIVSSGANCILFNTNTLSDSLEKNLQLPLGLSGLH